MAAMFGPKERIGVVITIILIGLVIYVAQLSYTKTIELESIFSRDYFYSALALDPMSIPATAGARVPVSIIPTVAAAGVISTRDNYVKFRTGKLFDITFSMGGLRVKDGEFHQLMLRLQTKSGNVLSTGQTFGFNEFLFENNALTNQHFNRFIYSTEGKEGDDLEICIVVDEDSGLGDNTLIYDSNSLYLRIVEIKV